jgi:transcriptional regulator with XRE-family HTH domain
MEKHSPSETLKYLHDRYVGNDPERLAAYERAVDDAHVARQVYRLRTEAGLSQREMAAKAGTTASVICRLEDAEYEGHSLSMLRRIAAAVNKRVVILFEPFEPTPAENASRATRNSAPKSSGKAKPARTPKKKGRPVGVKNGT